MTELIKSKWRRHQHGNMLVLSMTAIAGMLLVFGVALTFYFLLFAHNGLGEKAEVENVVASRFLNMSDNAGQMNNMVAASRELVFTSREMQGIIGDSHPEMLPLAAKLTDESRDGAKFVRDERGRLLQSTLADVRDWAKEFGKDDQAQNLQHMLPGIDTSELSLVNLDAGCISDIDSNVNAPLGNADLMKLDQKFINPRSNLYYGNITLSLPAPDNDLTFKLSSLPAPVTGTIAPERLLDNDLFKSTFLLVKDGQPQPGSCDQIPSALSLTARIKFQSRLGVKTNQMLVVRTTAAANGAAPMR
jgi:hypothetical protein